MKLSLSRALLVFAGLAVCAPAYAQHYTQWSAPVYRVSHSALLQGDETVPPAPGTAVESSDDMPAAPTPADPAIQSYDPVLDPAPCVGTAQPINNYTAAAPQTAMAAKRSKGAMGCGGSMLLDCCCCPEPCVTFEVGGIFLRRENPDNQVFMTNPAAGGAVVLQSDDAQLGWAGGIQFALTAKLDDCTDIQLSYFSISDWSDTARVLDTGVDYETPFTPVGFFFRAGEFGYRSELQNFEANVRREGCNWNWLYGFRHINLTENAYLQLTNPNAEVTTDVSNHLYGFQVGAENDFCLGGVDLNVWGKAGIYYNDNDQVCLTSGNFGNFVVTGDDDGVAFVGDAGIRAQYDINCNWSLYGGYQVLWVGLDSDGIALAPAQVAKIVGPPGTDTNGSAFYHGATFGIQMTR